MERSGAETLPAFSAGVPLAGDPRRIDLIEAAFPAAVVAGTRHDKDQMAMLDSER
jgi:hypothetical protein